METLVNSVLLSIRDTALLAGRLYLIYQISQSWSLEPYSAIALV